MSHHLDTPLAAQNGQLYINDLYVFKGERGTVFVMDVNSSITGDDIKYGFHPEARYEIKIHRDGGDSEELTYRVAFGEPDSEGRQSLTLHALTGAEARDDGATGTLVADGRTGEAVTSGPVRIWAGRIADPFYIDLGLLMTVNEAFKNGGRLDRSAWRPENAQNSFAGKTVESIVLEVADQEPMLRDGARPANYGFAVRNGRSMYDNVPEVMFSIVLNMAVPSGLGPDVTRDARSGAFPYVVAA